jgi:DNA-binding Lrp family transcriptional regulator
MHETTCYPRRSYIFVTIEPGKTRTALRGISALEFSGCRILTVEPVIGEYDIIAKIEGQDIDSIARVIFYGIQEVSGVLDVVASCCVERVMRRSYSRPDEEHPMSFLSLGAKRSSRPNLMAN